MLENSTPYPPPAPYARQCRVLVSRQRSPRDRRERYRKRKEDETAAASAAARAGRGYSRKKRAAAAAKSKMRYINYSASRRTTSRRAVFHSFPRRSGFVIKRKLITAFFIKNSSLFRAPEAG